MLGVDGYTVKWGADTTDFDRANRHVVNESRRGAQEFESHWSRAAKSASDKFVGFRNAGDMVKVGVAAAAGAVGLLTKSFQELGRQNEETRRRIESFNQTWKDLQAEWSSDTGGAGSVGDLQSWLEDYREVVSWVRETKDPGSTDAFRGAMRDRSADEALFNARKSAMERLVGERSGLVRSDVERLGQEDRGWRWGQFELEKQAALRKFAKEEASGDAMRIKAARSVLALEIQAAQTRLNADLRAFNAADEARDAKDNEERQRLADSQAAARTKFMDEDARREKALEDAREFLDITRRTAQIDTLRAQGRQQEANAAQIRLDAERDVAAVMERQDADVMSRLEAAEAILTARDAQLGGLTRTEARSDISTFLGPGGGGARGELAAQVLGSQNANYNRTISIAERQANLLEDIARNTAQPSLGVLGP